MLLCFFPLSVFINCQIVSVSCCDSVLFIYFTFSFRFFFLLNIIFCSENHNIDSDLTTLLFVFRLISLAVGNVTELAALLNEVIEPLTELGT